MKVPLSATKFLGPLGLVLIAGAGWLFLMSPQTNALAEVRAQIETTGSQNDAMRGQLVVLQRQQKNLKDTRTTAEALAAKFPPTADQPGLFSAVTAAAVTAGIPAKKVTTLTPTPPVVGSGNPAGGGQPSGKATAANLATQDVSLTVEGGYEEVLRLVKNLEQMPRAYLITGLTLSAGATPETFSATITGTMFVMPPAKDPATAKSPSETSQQTEVE